MAYGTTENNQELDGRVRDKDRFDFVDAQIVVVRGKMVETQDAYKRFLLPGVGADDYSEYSVYREAEQQLHDLQILRLGMSVGHDTTVENAVTQVLNWKDGER